MRKLISIGMIILFIATATAITLSSKTDAINYFTTYKANREANITSNVDSIQYTSNKICEIDYETETIICNICYTYKIDKDTHNNCMSLPEGTDETTDDQTVRDYVKLSIDTEYPKEKITYTERTMIGKTI